MISNEICDFKFKWDEIWYLMKSNEICEFEPVVSNENEICDTIWNEIKSNEICDFLKKMPKIISKQIASQHLKSLLSMTACDSLFSRDH